MKEMVESLGSIEDEFEMKKRRTSETAAGALGEAV